MRQPTHEEVQIVNRTYMTEMKMKHKFGLKKHFTAVYLTWLIQHQLQERPDRRQQKQDPRHRHGRGHQRRDEQVGHSQALRVYEVRPVAPALHGVGAVDHRLVDCWYQILVCEWERAIGFQSENSNEQRNLTFHEVRCGPDFRNAVIAGEGGIQGRPQHIAAGCGREHDLLGDRVPRIQQIGVPHSKQLTEGSAFHDVHHLFIQAIQVLNDEFIFKGTLCDHNQDRLCIDIAKSSPLDIFNLMYNKFYHLPTDAMVPPLASPLASRTFKRISSTTTSPCLFKRCSAIICAPKSDGMQSNPQQCTIFNFLASL